MIQRPSRRIFWKSNRGRGIRLRIAIYQQCRLFRGSEASRQVYRGGCLSNPTFLICNSNNPRQMPPNSREGSRIAQRMQLVSRGKRRRTMDFALGCSTWNSLEHAIRYHSIPVPRGIMAPASIDRAIGILFHVEQRQHQESNASNRLRQFGSSIVPRGTVAHASIDRGSCSTWNNVRPGNQTQAINCDNSELSLVPRGTCLRKSGGFCKTQPS